MALETLESWRSWKASFCSVTASIFADLYLQTVEGEQLDSQAASQPNAEAIAYKLEQDSLKFLTLVFVYHSTHFSRFC